MAYEHLIKSHLIERELSYGGTTETVYFRRLTAGERLQLNKFLKGRVEEGKQSFEVDMSVMDAKNHLMLTFSNVDKNGKSMFKTVKDVASLPADLVDELVSLCGDALKDELPGN